MSPPAVYLASRSPRREAVLRQLGVPYATVAIEIDESWDGHEPPLAYVQRLALAKARAGLEALASGPLLPVLGADTAVVIDDLVLGKPADRAQALAMLARLSGRVHTVISAVALIAREPEHRYCLVNTTQVRFRALSEQEREAYAASGEPIGKAGGYAIQGRAAAFIECIEGSYTGVMGLPAFETAELLARVGLNTPGLSRGTIKSQ